VGDISNVLGNQVLTNYKVAIVLKYSVSVSCQPLRDSFPLNCFKCYRKLNSPRGVLINSENRIWRPLLLEKSNYPVELPLIIFFLKSGGRKPATKGYF
jgi:hypothetical protein